MLDSIDDQPVEVAADSASPNISELNIKLKNGVKMTNKNSCLNVDRNHVVDDKKDHDGNKAHCEFYRDSRNFDSNGQIEKDLNENNNCSVIETTCPEKCSSHSDEVIPKINECYKDPLYKIKRGKSYVVFGNHLRSEGLHHEAASIYKIGKDFGNAEAIYRYGENKEYFNQFEKAKNEYKLSADMGYPLAKKKLEKFAQMQAQGQDDAQYKAI